jgi:methyl-accepting chemotaxis protein
MQYRPYSLSARTYTLWLFGLLGVIVCVVAVVFLLARVLVAANSINDKAADIKQLGGTINESTAAVLQLTKTNQVAASILNDVQPLSGQLSTTQNTAQGISNLASSINGSAGSIDSTAGQIANTAASINRSSASIAANASSIDSKVSTIDGQLASVLTVANSIKADTGAIRGTGQQIDSNANAIDCNLNGVAQLIGAPGSSPGKCGQN